MIVCGCLTDMPLAPNTRLGRYEIRSLLREGGMGEVYLAEDTTLRHLVAVKLLPIEFTADQDRLRRFEREAFAASSLNHPNILTIHEIGAENGHHFIATEFIDGESLRQRLKDGGPELHEVLEIGMQVASALAAAHAARIVHRDIKPENIMVRKDGIVKVLDFGLAKLAEHGQKSAPDTEALTRALHHTAPGVVMGTVLYMSPEQARGKETDERTDVWSLGVVLYEMVAGRLPFEGETKTDVLGLILHKEPPPLMHLGAHVPAELDRIVTKALRKDKEERYQVVKDLGLDLKSLKQRLEFEAELDRTGSPERNGQTRGAAATTGQAEHRRSRRDRPGRRRAARLTRHRARNTSSRESCGTSAARRWRWRRSC
ncbi:MAG: eukaryotic-like serine/threonine-protein kinase [Blastocatellia bacterium]